MRAAEIASVVTSAVSALFNWYAMRRGALLVGGEGGDFSKDLARVPRLVVGFVILLPRWLLDRAEKRFWSRFSVGFIQPSGRQAVPLKTLHLTNSWHETSGGIATFYRALLDEANRRGRRMRLVAPGPEDRVEKIGTQGKIYYLQSSHSKFNPAYRTIYPSQFFFGGARCRPS